MELEQRIAAVRRFNRVYTQRIGMLQEEWGKSPFSLTEKRVLYELYRRENPAANEIAKELGLDAGYLSRILRGFQRRGLVAKRRSPVDGRQSLLSLTRRGSAAFAPLEAYSNDKVEKLLGALSGADQARLLSAIGTVEDVLNGTPQRAAPYLVRQHQPGDMGWIVSRHGAVYSGEYGWDDRLEALVAEIVAAFLRRHDPKRERCWIAERDGENIGCVMLVADSKRVARLRLLLVDAKARGLGIGGRLTEECVRFARRAGYRKITLWTHSILAGARAIYAAAGFRLVSKKEHDDFGPRLTGESWELTL
jgi:DNA-binding MarR family transcriptional regulator/N-acetylglutamate synthase-like GNAT family acetyltransferase